MFCKYCGAEINEDQDVCLNCGKNVKDEPAADDTFTKKDPNLAGQNKWVMAILCFFLGSIGIHNFMMGETKKGVFKIIMTFVCGTSTILMLIDLVKILTDHYVVDKDALV